MSVSLTVAPSATSSALISLAPSTVARIVWALGSAGFSTGTNVLTAVNVTGVLRSPIVNVTCEFALSEVNWPVPAVRLKVTPSKVTPSIAAGFFSVTVQVAPFVRATPTVIDE